MSSTDYTEIKLLKTAWDTTADNSVVDPGVPVLRLTSRVVEVCLYLESYQPRDCYFEDILRVDTASN